LFEILRNHKTWLVYTPLVLYWLLIFTLTTLPTTSIPDVGIGDKISHFLAYFGLAVLVNLTFQLQEKYNQLRRRSHLYTILIVALYGFFDELHQLLIPGRICAFDDWVANIVGGVVGILFIIFLEKFDSKYFSEVK